ncbi:hypothetical protein [Nocardia veterana]|uniref:Excreted virulence factor EspC (Type VII ESX diderm) n=1 Tax=Nocardia veterana TaxID=132249 RepID=A0A7X6LYJ8_9NOCA|nr:hypothetical protein [Nocardia veterana]NKY86996.1 hypothetical protein [Nocardia veterana]
MFEKGELGHMTFKIDPTSLGNAARILNDLADDVHDLGKVPHLAADRGVTAMSGSAIAKALEGANAASTQAKDVLASRFRGIGGLLYQTAEHFHGTDVELAESLRTLGDLNRAEG